MEVKGVKLILIIAIAIFLVGCGTLTGIPSHGGGKRFAIEQRLVTTTIRGAIKQVDISALRGKTVFLQITSINDQGAGNMVGGRASAIFALQGITESSPITSIKNTFKVFDLSSNSSSATNQNIQGGANSRTQTFNNTITGSRANAQGTFSNRNANNTIGTNTNTNNTTGTASTTGNDTNTSTTNGRSTNTNEGTTRSTINSNGTNNNTTTNNLTNTSNGSSGSTTNARNNNTSNGTNNTTTTTGTVSTTQNGTNTGTSSGTNTSTTNNTNSNTTTNTGTVTNQGTNTNTSTNNGSSNNTGSGTNTATTNGRNTTQNTTNTSGTNNSTGQSNTQANGTGSGSNSDTTVTNANQNTRGGSSTGSSNFQNNNTQTNNSSTNQVLASQAEETRSRRRGTGYTANYGVNYRGQGSYNNFNVPVSDVGILQSIIRTYFYLNDVKITTDPNNPEISAIVNINIDVFGSIRSRLDTVVYNKETVRVQTVLEVMAIDYHTHTLVMSPQVGSYEASYDEKYAFWIGPLNKKKNRIQHRSMAEPMLVSFDDIAQAKWERDQQAQTHTPSSNSPSTANTPPAAIIQIQQTLQAWLDAWQQKNTAEYLSFYSPSFIPAQGVSIARWKQDRTNKLTNQDNIQIIPKNVQIQISPDQTRAKVTFLQEYRSANYQESSVKLLELESIGGLWKIVRESAQRVQ